MTIRTVARERRNIFKSMGGKRNDEIQRFSCRLPGFVNLSFSSIRRRKGKSKRRGFPLGRPSFVDLWPETIFGFRRPVARRGGDHSHVRGKGNLEKGFSSKSAGLRRSVAGEHLWILSTSS
ncbi:hypothetical protein MRB53_028105 [Persea americana]|uniref:Uncharacterized protein n=1 Tax=Persea americana TaxID=3435 RepID=A0ACC2KES0_PERAE|nr:hypothetical protein MRB53_028105 [Persea americana]